MIPISKAFELIQNTVQVLPVESVLLQDAVGRVLAEDVCSDVDSPPHDKSMMDGYAVKSRDIEEGRREFEVVETIAAGAWASKRSFDRMRLKDYDRSADARRRRCGRHG